MPSHYEHLAKAGLNGGLAEHLRALEIHVEWAIVAQFYRALHLVEAYFARLDVHHTTHRSRNRHILAEMRDLWEDYTNLDRMSRIARYDEPGLLGWGDFEAAQGAVGRIEEHLRL
jgi:hypothetical protein